MTSSDAATLPRFNSLLIVRLSAMGDIIHTLPAAGALREAFPHATLGWLIEDRWAELLCTLRYPRAGRRSAERPLVDRVHTVNFGQWRGALLSINTLQEIAVGLSELRGVKYDAVVDFQGAVRSALLARWSGAQTIFGDAQPRENAASMFYTRQVETSGRHVVEQALDLARAVIGNGGTGEIAYREASVAASEEMISPGTSAAEFPVDADAERKISCDTAGMTDFAVLNPGAGWGAKQWPAERYGAVARELAREGVCSLVNFGPGEEELAEAVEEASGGSARKIFCSIAELISLTRRARLLIGGDTGPMHLAAALRVPVVAIFGPTNPARNGPFGTRAIVLRSASSLTDHSRHREPEAGLLEITPEEVATAARELLGGAPRGTRVS
ncbi:MAG TPA: glycosyltransferase family 9 protein [Terriglobales bacterium]|nr:glycosyltransferase family 9 protein [Terriglobales bacterium]